MTRTTLDTLTIRVRLMIDDPWTLGQDTATGDGTTKVFWLNRKPVSSGGTISVGGTVQGTAAYTLNRAAGRLEMVTAPGSGAVLAVEYDSATFTDQEIQDALDRHRADVYEEELVPYEDTASGGSVQWLEYRSRRRDFETTDGGTAVFVVEDSVGSVIATGYVPDYARGVVVFDVSQGGSARYLSGRVYDVAGAAAELLRAWAAKASRAYDFTADGAAFKRSQQAAMLLEQAKRYERESWAVTIPTTRGDAT